MIADRVLMTTIGSRWQSSVAYFVINISLQTFCRGRWHEAFQSSDYSIKKIRSPSFLADRDFDLHIYHVRCTFCCPSTVHIMKVTERVNLFSSCQMYTLMGITKTELQITVMH